MEMREYRHRFPIRRVPQHQTFGRLHNPRATFGNPWIGRGGPVAWSPTSPDLTCLDFFLWGHKKQLVYEIVMETEENLVSKITVAAGTITDMPGIFERTRQSIVAVPVNATAVISILCKSSIASEIAVRDHMYHNEMYLF